MEKPGGEFTPVEETRESERLLNPRWAQFKQMASHEVVTARYTIAAGHSYRDFQVGSSATAFFDDSEIVHFWGGNTTRAKGDPRDCGEMKILSDARKVREDNPKLSSLKLFSIAVAGPVQPDDTSKLVSPTLHCCSGCRGRFVRDIIEDGPVGRDTVLLFAHQDEETYQMFTVGELILLHMDAQNKMIDPEDVQRRNLSYSTLEDALEAFESNPDHDHIVYYPFEEDSVPSS